MEEQNLQIRIRILQYLSETVETRLERLKMIEDSLIGGRGVKYFRATLNEAIRDHQMFNDRFNGFANESITSRKSVKDTSKRLLLLEREHHFLEDRCCFLIAGFYFLIRQQRKLVAGGDEIERPTLLEIRSGVIMDVFCVKKRLIALLTEGGGKLDDDWEDLKAVKDLAVNLGAKLSRLIVNLKIMMSLCDQIGEMFRTFKCSLEYVEADPKPGKSVVISKVVHLLEVTDYELKKKKFLERSSQLIDKGQIKQLVNRLMSEIFRLELILNDHGVPESKISNVTFLKARLRLYDADLKDAELKVNELGVLSSFINGSKDMDQSLENALQLKINEVWTQLEESCA